MIPADKLIMLDTGILVYLARGREAGHKIDDRYLLRKRAERPLICVVTVGEILALAHIWGWGSDKIEKLKALLRELVVVDIHNQKVLDKYGEIRVLSRKNGFSLGDNDAWIAAAAAATGAVLLTGDRDFDPLSDKIISREYVEPSDLK